MKQQKGIIYQLLNLINGKIYIGQTWQKLNSRYAQHLCDAITGRRNGKLQCAIRKYKKENFEIKELFIFYNQKELDYCERYLIAYYRLDNIEFGYNINEGGKNSRLTKSHIEKLKKPKTEEHKRKISKTRKEKFKNGELISYWTGKHLSDSSKQKMRKAKLGIISPKKGIKTNISSVLRRPIVRLTKDNILIEKYPCATINGFHSAHIISCCKGKLQTHKKFKWMYLENYEKYINLN